MIYIKKKLTALGLASIMLLSTVPSAYAEAWVDITKPQEIVQEEEEVIPKSRTMTIDEAVEYAKGHSYSITALEAAEATAEAQKEEARISLRDYKKKVVESGDLNTLLLVSGYSYRASLLSYRVAQRSTIQGGYEIESNVSNAFYSYLSNKNKVALSNELLKTAQERLLFAQTKFKNGTISANDLESFKMAVTEAENNLNAAQRTCTLSMRYFKTVINYPQDCEIIITGTFDRKIIDDTKPEKAAEKAKNSISRINIEENLELAKFKYDRAIGFYTANSVGGRSAKAEYAQAQLTYKNSIDQLEYGIYSAYNAMVTAYEGLAYLDENLLLTERKVEAAKKQYDLGLITSTDYLSAIQQLDSIKNTIADTELKVYLAKEAYRQTYDYENTIVQEDDPLL